MTPCRSPVAARALKAEGATARVRDVAAVAGLWRIVEMELWDRDDLDLVGPAFIEFGTNRSGRFAFVAVEASIDYRQMPRDGRPGVEFSGEGNDESDPVTGRGWAALADDGTLRGRIYIHLGDDSSFHAARFEDDPTRRPTEDRQAGFDPAGHGTKWHKSETFAAIHVYPRTSAHIRSSRERPG